ncbi:MAG TPA: Scr1 family TA system antitoxin-like transcriptional regulator [Pseudonocardiaceae bacterium]|jgi:hypothetical protein
MGAQKLVTVIRSGLGPELRHIRDQQRGLTLDDVCEKLGWPLSKLSRMETGKQCISEIDLGALLALYRVQGQERQQLRAMLDLTELPNVRMWVIPLAHSAKAGFSDSFYKMGFHADSRPVVHLESTVSAVFLEEPDKTDFYRRRADRLVQAALNPAKSAEFAARIRREHERTC